VPADVEQRESCRDDHDASWIVHDGKVSSRSQFSQSHDDPGEGN